MLHQIQKMANDQARVQVALHHHHPEGRKSMFCQKINSNKYLLFIFCYAFSLPIDQRAAAQTPIGALHVVKYWI